MYKGINFIACTNESERFVTSQAGEYIWEIRKYTAPIKKSSHIKFMNNICWQHLHS